MIQIILDFLLGLCLIGYYLFVLCLSSAALISVAWGIENRPWWIVIGILTFCLVMLAYGLGRARRERIEDGL